MIDIGSNIISLPAVPNLLLNSEFSGSTVIL
jgi:hypothetical protein